ncbi:DUF1631 domain-containing protein [Thermomonas brevis]
MESHDRGLSPPATLAHADLPPRVRAVLAHLLADADAGLRAALLDITQETELALLHATPGDDARADAEHRASLRTLRHDGHALATRFMAEVEATLANLRASPPQDVARAPVNSGLALSLLDDDAASDDSLLEAIAARTESRNSLALQMLGHRLGVLAGAPALEGDALPLGPRALVHALAQAAQALQLSQPARSALYAQFEKRAIPAYPTLLDVFNTRLVDDGILPHLRFIPIRPRAPSKAAGARDDAPQPPRDEGKPRDATPGAGGQPAAERRAAAPLQSVPGLEILQPQAGSGRFLALQDLLQRRRALVAKLRPGGRATPAISTEPLPAATLEQALRRMRIDEVPVASLEDVRHHLLAQELRPRDAGGSVALAEADNDAFELLGLFMDQLQRELLPSSPGEALVERLRLPLLQLALRDHDFFVDTEHPARQLLDAVSLAGAPWLGHDDHDPQWLGLLQQAVAEIEHDPDARTASFAQANHVLQAGLQSLARRTGMAERRQVEAARGREKLALARQHAHGEIAALIAGRDLPRFESILLEQAWADVLSLGHLRNGEGSDGWQQLLHATARIVERVAGQATAPPDPVLLAQIRAALVQVGYHEADARAIAMHFAGLETGEDDELTSRTGLLLQMRARARLGEGELSGQRREPLSAEAQDAFDRMKRSGTTQWLELEEAAGQRVRRRLAWASGRTGQTLLVNRRGQRVPAPDLHTLAQRVGSGEALLLAADIAPAEAAWQATTRNLQRMAAGGASVKEAGHGH